MSTVSIGFTNESTVLTDAQVQAAAICLQQQVDADFLPVYGIQANLIWLPKGQAVPPGLWQMIFADDSDQADALGYHEVTANGDPIGFVFAKSDLQDGTSWTVTASHELLEMLGDPDITTVEEEDNGDGSFTFRSKEVCDPCEDDSYAYTIPGCVLPDGSLFKFSDFIYPAWWNAIAPEGVKFDYGGHITKPFQILENGYIGILQVPKGPQWGQVQAEMKPGGKTAHRFSRRERRMKGRRNWRHSEKKEKA